MAGNNGLGVTVRTIMEDGQSWIGLAQEVKAVEEEIKALATSSRQRLIRAVDEEMRRVLREAMTRLSEMSWPELLPHAWEVRESPLLEAIQQDLTLAGLDRPQTHGTCPELCGKLGAGFAEGLNDYESSPAMATLAALVAPQEDARGHVGMQNGTEDHGKPPLEVAAEGPPSGSGETYSGTVQLVVAVEQSAIQALQFVDALCRHPSMRLQRLLGTAKGRMDIWVLLREPMHLKEALLGMEGVSQVTSIPTEGPQDDGVYLEVRLKEPVAAHGS